MQNKTSGFVGAALFFAASGIVIKVLGAVYKIVLGNDSFLGVIGVSYVAFIYPYYNILLAVSTSGIPSAIAKIIAGHNAMGEYVKKENVFKVVKNFMQTLGVIFALLLFFFAPAICRAAKFEGAVLTMQTIALAILVVPFMAAYRGYFQGHGDLKPFGISQIIEQICRVALGLGFALLLYPYGIEYAAAGAVLGTSLGAVFSTVFLMIYYKYFSKANDCPRPSVLNRTEKLSIIKEVLYYAIPISIGASIMPLIEMFDGILIKTSLIDLGIGEDMAQSLYSYHAFYSESVINFPIILFVAVQVSVLPAVSALVALKEKIKLANTIKIALKLTIIVALAASVGLFVLAKPVLMLLWPGLDAMHESTEVILRIMCFSVFFVAIYQVTSGIMQGMGLHIRNAVHLLIGALIKALLSYVLLKIPEINIKGAAISTAITFFVAGSLNVITLYRHGALSVNLLKLLVKPVAAVSAMAFVVSFAYSALSGFTSNTVSTLLSVVLGAAIYFIMIIALKIIEKEDLEFLPGKRLFSKFVK